LSLLELIARGGQRDGVCRFADHNLYAFDATGTSRCSGSPRICTQLWRAPTGDAVQSSPAVANGMVYVGSVDDKVYAFDAAGIVGCDVAFCSPLWTVTTGSVIIGDPAVSDGIVFVGSWDGNLYAIGHPWSSFGGSATHGGLAIDERKINTRDVSTLIHQPPGRRISNDTLGYSSSPAAANGMVYEVQSISGPHDAELDAFDATFAGCSFGQCLPRWRVVAGQGSSPTVVGDMVYVGGSALPNDGDGLRAFDATPNLEGCTSSAGDPPFCRAIWDTLDYGACSTPAVVNGTVYVTAVGRLLAFDAAGFTNCTGTPKTCTPLFSSDDIGTPGLDGLSSPAPANNMVYMGGLGAHAFRLP
jgi:outer membrane protein assembly factor BamB